MFRNKEILQITVCFFVITVVFTGVGFLIFPAAGILVLLSAAALGTVFFFFTRARYQKIAWISEQIDLVLHNADQLYISEAKEGELSILQSEVTKMTLRIREQNEALKKEKQHLADSLADIAHQLRTPLTSANLTLSLLKNEPDQAQRTVLIRETQESFAQMDWLLTSLLKLSRLDAGIITFQKQQIEVEELVNGAIRLLQIPMELHNIDLRTDIPKEAVLQGDRRWLGEAFQNILKNCMESAGDNGRIEILCRDTLLFTEITFHDSGPGFRKEDLPRLFERFYRGKNTDTAGYGIGLALCRTIITRQGGSVTAKNHPQGGAVFSIRFPK